MARSGRGRFHCRHQPRDLRLAGRAAQFRGELLQAPDGQRLPRLVAAAIDQESLHGLTGAPGAVRERLGSRLRTPGRGQRVSAAEATGNGLLAVPVLAVVVRTEQGLQVTQVVTVVVEPVGTVLSEDPVLLLVGPAQGRQIGQAVGKHVPVMGPHPPHLLLGQFRRPPGLGRVPVGDTEVTEELLGIGCGPASATGTMPCRRSRISAGSRYASAWT